MQVLHPTREETQIRFDSQESLEFEGLLRDLIKQDLPQYQEELVQNLFCQLKTQTKGYEQ